MLQCSKKPPTFRRSAGQSGEKPRFRSRRLANLGDRHAQRKDGARHRLDLRHRPRHRPRASPQEGANVTINGFGDKAAIEKERSRHREGIRRQGALFARRHDQAGRDRRHGARRREKTFGSLDVLVNNAGIQHVAPIEEFPIEKWDQIIAINLSSAFHAIRAAVPGMKARKWGRIINTASAHSLVASPFKVAYVSAKHGIAGLTKTVALEVATFGITVQLHLPRLCVDAAGREADSRHDEGAQHDRGAGQARRAAGGAADQGVRHRRAGRRARGLSLLRCGGSRSPAPTFRSTAAGPRRERTAHPRSMRRAPLSPIARRQAARSASISRCRAAARTARSPGACSTIC